MIRETSPRGRFAAAPDCRHSRVAGAVPRWRAVGPDGTAGLLGKFVNVSS